MERWVRIAAFAEIPDGAVRRFRLDFRNGWILRRGDAVKAYLDLCTHAGGSLVRQGDRFACLRHGATFDVASGAPLSGPATGGDPLPTLETKVEDGAVFCKRVTNDE